MLYGQLVIGPPGSGKTTYCHAMSEFLKGLGRRVAIVNLDPANDVLPYEANVEISHLITVDDVMQSGKLGPNGGLIYCMEFLEKNIDWLLEELRNFKDCYILFDCPGQVLLQELLHLFYILYFKKYKNIYYVCTNVTCMHYTFFYMLHIFNTF